MYPSVLNEDVETIFKDFKYTKIFNNKSILITGATGLIGSLMLRFFDKVKEIINIDVYVLIRDKQKLENLELKNEIHVIEQDILTEINISDSIDYIIHTASPTQSQFITTHPVDAFEINVLGTRNLLLYAKKAQVQSIVLLSSIEVYGALDSDKLITEDEYGYINHLLPRSSYPISKKSAETLSIAYFNQYNVPVKVARLTQTFGPGVSKDDNRVFVQFAKSIINSEDINILSSGLSSKSYIYTVDAINAILDILIKGQSGEVYNVANPGNFISIKDMAKALITHFKSPINLTIKNQKNTIYPQETQINQDVSKLSNLGWVPQFGLIEMYERLIKYLSK